MIKIPQSEIIAIRREAEIIATGLSLVSVCALVTVSDPLLARKEEEKKDLWALWNDYGSDLPDKHRGPKQRTVRSPSQVISR
jgi:hypothetical protein